MCTRVVWSNANGSVIVGRNMDYHRDLDSNLWKLPRGIKRDDGVNGALSWVARYGSVAITAMDMMTVDGLNEAGLSGHILWLAESEYGQYEPSRPVLSQAVWLQYFLDNYASVAEAVAWVKENRTQVFQLIEPSSGEAPAIHLALDDSSGDSAIFEYIDGEVIVYHSPEHQVMTNSPPYDQQLAMLKQVRGFGGSMALPGSTLASDRFARAAYYVERLAQPNSQLEAIASMFSVMRNVAQPFRVPDPGKPEASQTIWQSVADLTRRRLVFESTTRPNIIWVDLDRLDFSEDSGESKIDLGSQLAVEGGLAGNVSDRFTPTSGLKFLNQTMLTQLKAEAQSRRPNTER